MREGSRCDSAGVTPESGLEPAAAAKAAVYAEAAEAADAIEDEDEEDVESLELESYPEEGEGALVELCFFGSFCLLADLPDAEPPLQA